MSDERRFPIQGESVRTPGSGGLGRSPQREAGWVPWGVAEEAYKVYSAKYGKDQSLETLASRGGFGWSELVWLLQGGTREGKATMLIPMPEAKHE